MGSANVRRFTVFDTNVPSAQTCLDLAANSCTCHLRDTNIVWPRSHGARSRSMRTPVRTLTVTETYVVSEVESVLQLRAYPPVNHAKFGKSRSGAAHFGPDGERRWLLSHKPSRVSCTASASDRTRWFS